MRNGFRALIIDIGRSRFAQKVIVNPSKKCIKIEVGKYIFILYFSKKIKDQDFKNQEH